MEHVPDGMMNEDKAWINNVIPVSVKLAETEICKKKKFEEIQTDDDDDQEDDKQKLAFLKTTYKC